VPDRPDILFLLTDQQRADTLAAAGCPWMITPNLDRLAADGVTFTNAFCCGATCVASRAAMFTGMFAHHTGVYSFDPWAHHRTWLHDLREAGYYVANLGKMHHSPVDAPMAFHERRIVENKTSNLACDDWKRFLDYSCQPIPVGRHRDVPGWSRALNSFTWELEEQYHSDAFVGDMAVRWLERWDGRQPLFLEIGFPGPHEPYDPPARFLDLYRDRPTPPRIMARHELDSKPPEHRELRTYFAACQADAVIDLDGQSDEAIADMRRHYYANISLIDEKIGQILDVLERKGRLDNTIIVFTSDHGDNLGDHDLAYKWVMYDSVTRIPLIVRTPETVGRARMDDGLFTQMDFGPTLLDCAGVPVPSRLDGTSRRMLITDPTAPHPEVVCCQDNYQTMVRTADAKLVHYTGQPYGELYDLKANPEETHNLYDEPAHRELRAAMERRLLDWMTESLYLGGGYHAGKPAQYAMRYPQTNADGKPSLMGRFR